MIFHGIIDYFYWLIIYGHYWAVDIPAPALTR